MECTCEHGDDGVMVGVDGGRVAGRTHMCMAAFVIWHCHLPWWPAAVSRADVEPSFLCGREGPLASPWGGETPRVYLMFLCGWEGV